jgi:dienelactone hydrolase
VEPHLQFSRVILAIILSATCLSAQQLPDLQRPPARPPTEAPRLSPLAVDAAGEPLATPRAWVRRREELRREWVDFLGAFPRQKVALAPEFGPKEPLPTFTRQRLTYQIEDGVRTDAMLLVPIKPKRKLPAIVLFHPTYSNHFARAVGLEDLSSPERHQAVQLVEAGYIVLAPRCFIYSDLPAGYQKNSERIWTANVRYMQERHPDWLGMTRMTWDGIRALDLIETLPNVDPKRIGIFGHSLGAKEVLYVAAFDKRARCTVFSEGGIGMKFSNWEDGWYLGPTIKQPGFVREHHELMAMIAPRPFLLLAGNSADDDRSWAFIETVLPVYRLLGAGGNLAWFNHGLGHRYGAEARTVAEAFLAYHLKGRVPPQP